MKGLFISFEGNDGSGKSSVLKAVQAFLNNNYKEVVYTREPGGSPIAEKIREVILDKDNLGMDGMTEALLYAASRREHVVKTIKPALEAGKVVLSDRFIDSSLVYQGVARNLGIDRVKELNDFATDGLMPDITIFICVRPEVGFQRISKNNRELDRLELEKMDFHQQVYQGYVQLAEKFSNRIIKINGEQPLEDVIKETILHITRYLGEK